MGNTTAEIICLLENVVFAIDTSMDGIGRNYPSSYYSFDFGDGTAGDIVYFTHAELMSSNIEVSHQYTMPSCDSGDGVQGSNFIISKILFNKISFLNNRVDHAGMSALALCLVQCRNEYLLSS